MFRDAARPGRGAPAGAGHGPDPGGLHRGADQPGLGVRRIAGARLAGRAQEEERELLRRVCRLLNVDDAESA